VRLQSSKVAVAVGLWAIVGITSLAGLALAFMLFQSAKAVNPTQPIMAKVKHPTRGAIKFTPLIGFSSSAGFTPASLKITGVPFMPLMISF
jgi:hypothetical protein